MRKLRFTNKAVEDLSSIWRYTFQEWSEKQADEYYKMLISACNRILGESIVLNRSYDEIAENLYGFKAGHHLIFYRDVLWERPRHLYSCPWFSMASGRSYTATKGNGIGFLWAWL